MQLDSNILGRKILFDKVSFLDKTLTSTGTASPLSAIWDLFRNAIWPVSSRLLSDVFDHIFVTRPFSPTSARWRNPTVGISYKLCMRARSCWGWPPVLRTREKNVQNLQCGILTPCSLRLGANSTVESQRQRLCYGRLWDFGPTENYICGRRASAIASRYCIRMSISEMTTSVVPDLFMSATQFPIWICCPTPTLSLPRWLILKRHHLRLWHCLAKPVANYIDIVCL